MNNYLSAIVDKKMSDLHLHFRKHINFLIKKVSTPPGLNVLTLVNSLEAEMINMGCRCAFPTNIAIMPIVAHWTPGPNFKGILTTCQKSVIVDFGFEYKNQIFDTALTYYIGSKKKIKKEYDLVNEKVVNIILDRVKYGARLDCIGDDIVALCARRGHTILSELGGHSIDGPVLHGRDPVYHTPMDMTDSQVGLFRQGLYAIEPFFILYSRDKTTLEQAKGPIISYTDDKGITRYHCERWGSLNKDYNSTNISVILAPAVEKGLWLQIEHVVRVTKSSTVILTLENGPVIRHHSHKSAYISPNS